MGSGLADGDVSLARAISGPLPGARAVPGDCRGLLDRKFQDRGVQPGSGHWCSFRRPICRSVRTRARIGYDQILSVPAVPVRDRLLGRPAVHAGVEARRPEASVAGGRREHHGPRHFDPRCQGARAGSGLCGWAHVGCPHPERRHGNGDGRDQLVGLVRGGPRAVCCSHRRSGCRLLHLRLCRCDLVLHGDCPCAAED